MARHHGIGRAARLLGSIMNYSHDPRPVQRALGCLTVAIDRIRQPSVEIKKLMCN